MNPVNRTLQTGTITLILLAGLIITGCQSTATYYQGYKAEDKNVIQLSDQSAQGSWETFDLNLNYQTAQSNDRLTVNGAVNFSLYHETNIKRIRNLSVYLFFLDKDAMVIETALLKRTPLIHPDDQLTFTDNLAIPSGATAFAFGYRGQAHGDGDGGGMSLDGDGGGGGGMEFFYELPKRPKS